MEKHYNIHIEYTFPDAQEVTDLVRAKGMFSFYEDGHQECCRIRKVKTLEIPVKVSVSGKVRAEFASQLARRKTK